MAGVWRETRMLQPLSTIRPGRVPRRLARHDACFRSARGVACDSAISAAPRPVNQTTNYAPSTHSDGFPPRANILQGCVRALRANSLGSLSANCTYPMSDRLSLHSEPAILCSVSWYPAYSRFHYLDAHCAPARAHYPLEAATVAAGGNEVCSCTSLSPHPLN